MMDIRQALGRVGAAEAEAVASFGLERRYSTGLLARSSGVFEWEQRFHVGGDGIARLTAYRSLGDRGGDASGVYEATLPPEQVPQLAAQTLASGILDYDAGRIEPGDLMIRLRLTALGCVHDAFLSMDRVPPESIRSLLTRLGILEQEVRRRPVRTVSLRAELEGELRVGGARLVPVVLVFRNDGPRGHWMRHPAAVLPDGALERREVSWGRMPEVREGETPLPVSFLTAGLEPLQPWKPRTDQDPVWLAPNSEIRMPCVAAMEFAAAGAYYLKASYTTFTGTETHEREPRWVGGVFAPALEVTVR